MPGAAEQQNFPMSMMAPPTATPGVDDSAVPVVGGAPMGFSFNASAPSFEPGMFGAGGTTVDTVAALA